MVKRAAGKQPAELIREVLVIEKEIAEGLEEQLEEAEGVRWSGRGSPWVR
ncbi:MAG: hypothetical protein KatS3mg082_2934 [Nitrospiraceae bacterium]|nr:MAG: hypothetical protein KatS3mg081_2459 [Gemmatimonadales bacterium]GIW56530.1 MAG: hypothetical protein KatS3mg082_2934 [Nitrospiraceae bacterium]